MHDLYIAEIYRHGDILLQLIVGYGSIIIRFYTATPEKKL